MNIESHQSAAPGAPAPTPRVLALSEVLERLRQKQHLSRIESSVLLDSLLDPSTKDDQIATILTALAEKGETAEELTGMAEAMRARMVHLE